MMIRSIHSALNGLQRARSRFDRSAERVSRAGTDSGPEHIDLATEMVDMVTAKHEFSANAASMKTAFEMLGTLIDLKA